MKKLWVEAYRPKTLADYVFQDASQREMIEGWIREKAIGHLLFHGPPGTGKTTLAKVLVNELDIDEFDFLQINASRDNGADFIRSRIEGFVSTLPFGRFKVVLLDECLDENTEVVVLRNGSEQLVPIKNLDDTQDLVKSFNIEKNRIEWKPFELFDKHEQEVMEVEFENGEVVICTLTHKWYVHDDETQSTRVIQARDLHKYNHILT